MPGTARGSLFGPTIFHLQLLQQDLGLSGCSKLREMSSGLCSPDTNADAKVRLAEQQLMPV